MVGGNSSSGSNELCNGFLANLATWRVTGISCKAVRSLLRQGLSRGGTGEDAIVPEDAMTLTSLATAGAMRGSGLPFVPLNGIR